MSRYGVSATVALLLFCGFSHSADVTLAWDANAETDLAGYRVWEKNAAGGWNALGTVGPSASPVFVLVGFTAQNTRTFAVSAFNTQGLESGMSNELALRTPGQPKNLRVVK